MGREIQNLVDFILSNKTVVKFKVLPVNRKSRENGPNIFENAEKKPTVFTRKEHLRVCKFLVNY